MKPRGFIKKYSGSLSLMTRVLDITLIIASGMMAFWIRFHTLSFPDYYLTAFLIAALLTALIFPRFNVYASHRLEKIGFVFRQLFLALITTLVSLVFLSVLLKSTANFSRTWMFLWLFISLVALFALRLMIYLVLRAMRRRGLNQKHIVIVGIGHSAREIISTLQKKEWAGFKVLCCLTDTTIPENTRLKTIPVQRMPLDLDPFIQNLSADEVWIALPLKEEDKIQKVLHDLRHNTVNIRLLPELFDLHLLNHSLLNLDGLSIINLRVSTMIGTDCLLKWIEDKILSMIILMLISPLLIAIAITVRLTSKGPALFKQKRHGWDGRLFTLYKFRTMKVHQEPTGQMTQAVKNDPRLTAIGAFLRRTSLDELPQLLNVLKGDMSMVGPRPHPIAINERFKESVSDYMQRHRIKPGITGWAQVNGYRGETDTLEKMEKRVEYDLYYIEHWSLWLDIKILFLTIWKGFVNPNAY